MCKEFLSGNQHYQIQFLFKGKIKTYFSFQIDSLLSKHAYPINSFNNKFKNFDDAETKAKEIKSKIPDAIIQIVEIKKSIYKICEV